MAKLELRIRELEMELGTVQTRTGRATRLSRGLNAESRNCNSNNLKITRTKISCLSYPTNSNRKSRPTRLKLRKLKKLLPLTWPSIARLNKNLRRLKSVARWQVLPWLHCCKFLFTKTNCSIIL